MKNDACAKRRSLSAFFCLIATCGSLLFGTLTFAQQSPSDKPLGDVAREQKSKQKKKASLGNTYTGEGTPAAPSTADDSSAEPKSPLPSAETKPPDSSKTKEKTDAGTNLLDQAKSSESDFILVPAGTQIKVDRTAGKVAWPVRVGFATPIPALSKVTIEDWGQTFDGETYYQILALTSVTVDKVTYKTKAKGYAAGMEVTFTLEEPLKINR